MTNVLESKIKLQDLNAENLNNYIQQLASEIQKGLRQDEKAWKLFKLLSSRGLLNQMLANQILSTILEQLQFNPSNSADLLYVLSKIIPLLPADSFPDIVLVLIENIRQLNLNLTNIAKFGMITSLILENIVLLLKSNIVRTIIAKPENLEFFSRLISLYSKALITLHRNSIVDIKVGDDSNEAITAKYLPVEPEILQIFTMLKYTCQIFSIIKLPKPQDLKKILFIFKFLIATIDDLEEFEPDENMSDVEADQESQYDKGKLVEICRPSLLKSVVEYILQLLKLGSCAMSIKDFVVWIKIIQLLQDEEYISKYPSNSKLDYLKVSILKLLAFVWSDFLKTPDTEMVLINKSLVPSLVLPCGMIIDSYFCGTRTISEFNAALVLVSEFLLYKNYKSAAIDSGILEYLAHSNHIKQSLQKENLVYIQFLEKISHDSTIRFKMSTTTSDKNILNFMAGLISGAVQNIGLEHMEDILGNVISFLNQYFGHDKVISDLFCCDESPILEKLINLMTNVISDMLSLDLQESTTNIAPQTIKQVSHFIDSLLTFEKPQIFILSHGLISSLAKIMLNINHSDVPEIFSKIIGRILTDPNLTLRLVKYMTIPLYFEAIYPSTATEVQDIVDSHLPQFQPILLSLLEYNKSGADTEVQWKCVLSLGYVSSKHLVKTILTKQPYTEGGISKSQSFHIMTSLLDIIQRQEKYAKNGEKLLQHLSLQIPGVIQTLGTSYYFYNENTPHAQSSLIQHILYAHESISVQVSNNDNAVTFLLPDDPNYHTVRCRCDKQVFCQQSPVFDQMLRGSFIEGQSKIMLVFNYGLDQFESGVDRCNPFYEN
ncbi:hypothetical protein HDV06_001573 [Boothiomyces sp. JEL0866]|nr:hypothetical protein HDV06_001573 [Boothiomyces sp. JEL0866]